MAKQLFANNVSTQIMEFLSATDTTITVSSTSRFPTISGGDWIMATIVPVGGQGTPEVVKITAFSGNDLTVVRGQEGSSAQSFTYGALLELRVTKGSLEELRDFTQSGTGAVVRTKADKMTDEVSAIDFGMSTSATSAVNKTALVAALAASVSVYIPKGTYNIDGPIDITNKRIRGDGIFKTILQIPGTNTQTTLLYNNKDSTAAWGSGGSLELRDLSLSGNWDGSTALADASWDNTAALLKLGAGSGIRLIDVEVKNSYGHGASFFRLGYATFTRPKVRTNRKNGLHFEAPSGADAITSTWILNGDLNSNRGVANIYVKNGVGFFVLGCVHEDTLAGVYIDGNDNRNVTISENHAETCTNGLLHFVGAGINTAMKFNFGDSQITRTNADSQRVYAIGNTGMLNAIDQSVETGSGTSTGIYQNGFFGPAVSEGEIGRTYFRSNNNANASVHLAAIRGVHTGTVNEAKGSLELGSGNSSTVWRARLDENGHLYPLSGQTYDLGKSTGNRWRFLHAQNVVLAPGPSVTPANNGEVMIEFTGNTQLKIKAKGDDGVVRSVSLTLA